MSNIIITKEDLAHLPMDEEHKGLVKIHWDRLTQIIGSGCDEARKQLAREQLAGMTLVIMDYKVYHQKAVNSGHLEPGEPMESMVHDIVDASLCTGDSSSGIFSSPPSMNRGRRREKAEIMQFFDSGAVEDIMEIWDMVHHKPRKIVPDVDPHNNIAEGIQWSEVLHRSNSDSKLVLQPRAYPAAEDRKIVMARLLDPEMTKLSLKWPPDPSDQDSRTGTQRCNVVNLGLGETVPDQKSVTKEEVCSDCGKAYRIAIDGEDLVTPGCRMHGYFDSEDTF